MVLPELNPTSGSQPNNLEAAVLQLLAAVRAQGELASAAKISPIPFRAVTVADLCNHFILAKDRAGRSENYLSLLIKELRPFAAGRENRPAASVSAAEIEGWVHGQGWSARTVKGRLMTLNNMFAWAVMRGYLPCNPAKGVDMPTLEDAPPGIHTPAQVVAVLEAAKSIDLDAMRCMAVRYFAGLRTSEAVNLEENEIGDDWIEVTAAKSKTRRRRLVTVQPALRAWLAVGGSLPLRQVNNRLRAVTAACGVPWHHNATRHSFVTYHLAEFQNAAKTALEAGHTEQILFNHYREVVKPAVAHEFWAIRPKTTH